MSEAVLDSSAVLAVILREPGQEEIGSFLPGALLSTVNLAEVVGKLLDGGATEAEARRMIGGLDLIVVPFDPEDAWATGLLRTSSRDAGLSLGDRACLALAFSRRLPAITTDRAWSRLGLGAAVRVVGR